MRFFQLTILLCSLILCASCASRQLQKPTDEQISNSNIASQSTGQRTTQMNRVNLICLGVRDMEKSLAFYRNIGFQTFERGNNPPIVFFNNQGSKLELYPLELLAQDINADNPPALAPQASFGGITLACNLKSEAEVDAMIKTVELHGGTIAKQPQKVFWGGYSGYFQDPDGYYWEVAYADVWKFDQNDMLVISDEL